jgi:hypothetical protein
MMNGSAPFRLLDLPAELRNMIYAHIPMVTHYHTFEQTVDKDSKPLVPVSTTTLVVKSLPVAIPATCKQLQYEVTPFLQSKLAIIATEPLRLIVDSLGFRLFIGTGGYLSSARRGYIASSMIVSDGSAASMCAFLRQHQMNDVHEVDMYALVEFVGAYEKFVQRRRPLNTTVAVVRHPGQVLEKLAGQFMMLDDWRPILPGVASFMVRKQETDDVDDPPTVACPGGVMRYTIRLITQGLYRSRIIDDVSEEEWQDVWLE